jgi:hypothetical protein
MALTPRGYIKTISGNKRMRWVRPPNSADNLALPQNQVVFDSASAKIFGVYTSGVWARTIPETPTKIVTWPSLGYIPLTRWWYSPTDDTSRVYPMLYLSFERWELSMESEATGLWVGTNGTGSEENCTLRYVVFRMPC